MEGDDYVPPGRAAGCAEPPSSPPYRACRPPDPRNGAPRMLLRLGPRASQVRPCLVRRPVARAGHFLVRAMVAHASPPLPSVNVLRQSVTIACVQMATGPNKAENLARARFCVREAAHAGARIVVLPECFNSPYGCSFFPDYAEPLRPAPPPARDAPSFHALAAMAADNAVFLVGGSVPERRSADVGDDTAATPACSKFYNTSLVFAPDGSLLDTTSKIHLFDIDIPGRITFRESDVLSPGNRLCLVDLPGYGIVAVAICYDIRFPELAAIAARRGAFALVYPAAFNLTTGPLHWELLARARAVDNQLYVAMCSPARDMSASYPAWGHSLVVDPMARVFAEADEKETIVYAHLDPALIAEARKNIPLACQRRFDVYPDVSKASMQAEESSPPKASPDKMPIRHDKI